MRNYKIFCVHRIILSKQFSVFGVSKYMTRVFFFLNMQNNSADCNDLNFLREEDTDFKIRYFSMCSRNSSHFTETNALLPLTRAAIRHSITEFNPDHSLSSLNWILILSSLVRLGLTFSLFTSNFTLQVWHVSHILHASYYAVAILYSLIWHGDTPHYVRLFILPLPSHPLPTLCSRTLSECERVRNLQWPWRGLLFYLKMLLHLKMLCSISDVQSVQ